MAGEQTRGCIVEAKDTEALTVDPQCVQETYSRTLTPTEGDESSWHVLPKSKQTQDKRKKGRFDDSAQERGRSEM